MFTSKDIEKLTVTDTEGTYCFISHAEVAIDKDGFAGYDPDDKIECVCCPEVNRDEMYLAVSVDRGDDGEIDGTWWCKWCLLENANMYDGSPSAAAVRVWELS